MLADLLSEALFVIGDFVVAAMEDNAWVRRVVGCLVGLIGVAIAVGTHSPLDAFGFVLLAIMPLCFVPDLLASFIGS